MTHSGSTSGEGMQQPKLLLVAFGDFCLHLAGGFLGLVIVNVTEAVGSFESTVEHNACTWWGARLSHFFQENHHVNG